MILQNSKLYNAVTVVAAYTVMGWIGCPLLFDAIAQVANVPGLEGIIPTLHPVLSGLVIASVAWTAPGVYRARLAQDSKEREMLMRSLTITGRLP